MAEINPEMLKQLLAEFEEKQAVTTEEINEIEKQIVELEARIEESRDRLKAVERDREKVGAMKSRYAEGDWSTVLKELAVQKAAAEAAELAAPAAPAEKPEKTKKGKSSNVAASDNGRGKNEAPAAFEASPAAPEISVPQFQSLPEAPPQVAPHVPTLAPTMEMDMPQTLPTPPPPGPPASESLFPFSQAQESAGDQAWAPTPAMSWESVSAQSFPPDTTEPQPTGYQLTPD